MTSGAAKLFFILIGGAAALVGAAYVTGALDPYLPGREQPPAVVAPEPQQAPPPAEAGIPVPQSAEVPAQEPAAESEGKPPAEAAAEREAILPTFDLVRVEPDGSLVIAGHAEPLSAVEAIVESAVIGTTRASDSGDFVLVLDEPLRPGDYVIMLRATGPEDIVTLSQETAVVSVPERPEGQVLALVEQPGAASRIMAVPEPAVSREAVSEPEAAPTPAPASPMQEGAESTEEPAAAPAGEDAQAQAAHEPEEAREPVATPEEPGRLQEPAIAAASPEDVPEPVVAVEGPAAAGEPAPTSDAGQEAAGQPEAVVPEEAVPEPAAPQPGSAVMPAVTVEAVEIEDRRIFVAGTAEGGRFVRVYAGEDMLGEAQASPTGRFLVEAERDLPVGEYLIRADLLGPDRSSVIARAVVPFTREPGAQIAAVAPRAEPPASAAQPAPGPGAAPVAESGLPVPVAEAPSAPPAETGPAAQPARPAAEEAAVASGTTDPAIPESTAARLEPAEGSVIIRRGDTLWHISRRVYGRGVRYSTIYLANQDQIADPDRIWPGQIFAVPGETEEGEPADLSAIADREREAR